MKTISHGASIPQYSKNHEKKKISTSLSTGFWAFVSNLEKGLYACDFVRM
jgi:hypothetical protein